MSSSFKYTNKYTLQKPINKEMYEQAQAQGLQIYDTAGRKAVGVDSATGKVKYEYENKPSNSSVTIPGTGTTGGKIGGDIGKITHDNLTGTGDDTGTKTSVFKPQFPQKSPEKLPGTVDTPKITKFPLKVNDGVYKPETTWRTMPKASALSEGQRAYSEMESALSTMYSPEECQALLSKSTPEKIEENLPIADSVIKKNIDSGRVNADYYVKHPFERNILAFKYSGDGSLTKNDYKKLNSLGSVENKGKNTEASSWVNTSEDLQKFNDTNNKTPALNTPSFYNLPNLPDDMAEFVRKSRNILPGAQLLPAPENNTGMSWEEVSLINQYSDVIVKALNKTAEGISSHYSVHRDYLNNKVKFDDAISKIIEGVENKSGINPFYEGTKVKIEINPNYNTSGDELIGELAGFIPVLGEISAIVDFTSDEKKDISKVIDATTSAITSGDISKLTPVAKQLKSVGKILDAIGIIDCIETIINWDNSSKKATEITVYVQNNDNGSYMYKAIADNNLNFKELYSAYTGTVINENDPSFQITMN